MPCSSYTRAVNKHTISAGDRDVSNLPSLPALQAWVHRPQAVAACFVSDIYNLQALSVDEPEVSYTTRDVFLLGNFPCKIVAIVGFVAAVEHKEASMVVTIDDGGPQVVLVQVRPRITQVAAREPVAVVEQQKQINDTFKSARERKMERKAALVAAEASKRPALITKTFVRPNIRVGDIVRVVGRVDEWGRRRPTGESDHVRQVIVDEASGSGSISVVDEEDQFLHTALVHRLHKEVYSQKFEMPSAQNPASALLQNPASTMLASPARSSPTKASPAKSMVSSIASDTYDGSMELDMTVQHLPDPSSLSSSNITPHVFKAYIIEYLQQQVEDAMRAVLSLLDDASADPFTQIPTLASVFPEYAAITTAPRTNSSSKRIKLSSTQSRFERQPLSRLPDSTSNHLNYATPTQSLSRTGSGPESDAWYKMNTATPTKTANGKRHRSPGWDATPRAQPTHLQDVSISLHSQSNNQSSVSTFRSRRERERDRQLALMKAEGDMSGTHSQDLEDLVMLSPPTSRYRSRLASPSPMVALHASTLTSILESERLRSLASRLVYVTMRRQEKVRRQRVKARQTPTLEEQRSVAERRALGLRSSDWEQMYEKQREEKMLDAVRTAVRDAVFTGDVVEIRLRDNGPSNANADTAWERSRGRSRDSTEPRESREGSNVSVSDTPQVGYIRVSPDLLAPLLIPLHAAESYQRTRAGLFLSKAERQRRAASRQVLQSRPPRLIAGACPSGPGSVLPATRDGGGDTGCVDLYTLTSRLRAWGEEGRWERVGEDAVCEAMVYAEARGWVVRGEWGWYAREVAVGVGIGVC